MSMFFKDKNKNRTVTSIFRPDDLGRLGAVGTSDQQEARGMFFNTDTKEPFFAIRKSDKTPGVADLSKIMLPTLYPESLVVPSAPANLPVLYAKKDVVFPVLDFGKTVENTYGFADVRPVILISDFLRRAFSKIAFFVRAPIFEMDYKNAYLYEVKEDYYNYDITLAPPTVSADLTTDPTNPINSIPWDTRIVYLNPPLLTGSGGFPVYRQSNNNTDWQLNSYKNNSTQEKTVFFRWAGTFRSRNPSRITQARLFVRVYDDPNNRLQISQQIEGKFVAESVDYSFSLQGTFTLPAGAAARFEVFLPSPLEAAVPMPDGLFLSARIVLTDRVKHIVPDLGFVVGEMLNNVSALECLRGIMQAFGLVGTIDTGTRTITLSPFVPKINNATKVINWKKTYDLDGKKTVGWKSGDAYTNFAIRLVQNNPKQEFVENTRYVHTFDGSYLGISAPQLHDGNRTETSYNVQPRVLLVDKISTLVGTIPYGNGSIAKNIVPIAHFASSFVRENNPNSLSLSLDPTAPNNLQNKVHQYPKFFGVCEGEFFGQLSAGEIITVEGESVLITQITESETQKTFTGELISYARNK